MNQDDRDALPVVPTLAVRSEEPGTAQRSADQGPAPADLTTREAPPVPAPSGEGLSADAVTTLLGGNAEQVEANLSLEVAEGLTPDTES